MPPRYRTKKDITEAQRERLVNVCSNMMIMRFLLPTAATWTAVTFGGLGVILLIDPAFDIEDPVFLWIYMPLSILFCAIAGVFFFVLMMRWLVRYRTERRGRDAGLREVLRPTDMRPANWRWVWLRLYGVKRDDLKRVPHLWRTAE